MGLNEDTFLPRVGLNARRLEAIARDQRRSDVSAWSKYRVFFVAVHESAFGRLCCKTILPVRACKIDSRSGVDTQR
jgi:hypothetical protein